jgi:hypothetical protein
MDDYILPQGAHKILQIEDAEAIARKIEESDFAKGLMQRIRDVMRRVRLGAPNEAEPGSGLDPNTVAEYLDHTLPDARVPDFEKVCLESDAHLAEVGCCHQILALVLREPSEVDEATRQRLYQLPHELAAQSRGDQPVTVVETASEVQDDGRPIASARAAAPAHESRIPEYLREEPGARPSWRSIIVVACLLLIVLGVWLVARTGDVNQLVARLLPWRQAGEVLDQSQSGVPGPAEREGAPPQPSRETPGTANVPPPGEAATKPEQPNEEPRVAPPSPKPPIQGASGVRRPPPVPGADLPRAEAPAEGTKVPSAKTTARPKSEPGKPEAPAPAAPAVQGEAEPKPEAVAVMKPPSKTGPAEAQQVGQVVSTKEVLLRLNGKTGVWQRLADDAPLYSDDRLIGLPAFRPRISLAGKIGLQLISGVGLTVAKPGPQGVPGIAVEYGRLMAKAEEAGGGWLGLRFGDHGGLCRLADSDSVVALEVSRLDGAGADPETQPGSMVADLYVISGKIVWRGEPVGKEIPLNGPVRLSLGEQPLEPVALQQFPKWASADSIAPLDQRAAGVLDRDLTLGRSVMLGLRELTDHRQREVRWLAARSLSLAGDYAPLLRTLEEPDQGRFWTEYIEQLRGAVYRSPQSAAAVRTAMESRYGPQGAALYEMLWKYRPDTLQPEDANRLVGFLDHDMLPFRVLSFWNLKSITGRTLYYRPEEAAAKRQTAIQKWRELLKATPTLRGISSSSAPAAAAGSQSPSEAPSEAPVR